MEWLDEFRLSENEKEDEEVWFIKYRSLTLFSKIDHFLVIINLSVTGS